MLFNGWPAHAGGAGEFVGNKVQVGPHVDVAVIWRDCRDPNSQGRRPFRAALR